MGVRSSRSSSPASSASCASSATPWKARTCARTGLSWAVRTLAHELGHVRADHEGRFADTYHRSVDCRGIAEIEAESIAYLVTTAAGLDSGGYSVPYVAGWSGG